MMNLSHYLETPLGLMEIQAIDTGIQAIGFVASRQRESGEHPLLKEAAGQLAAYFAGRLSRFDLPLSPQGTGFQRKVWSALQRVPYGQTASYGQIARQIGQPGAGRAVGAANGRNPVAIVVPCHRIIGANGTLTGYAGGLERKAWLLKLEQSQQELI